LRVMSMKTSAGWSGGTRVPAVGWHYTEGAVGRVPDHPFNLALDSPAIRWLSYFSRSCGL